MKEMGADTVLAGLKRGLRIDDDQARDGLSFDNFRYDVQQALSRKAAKNKKTVIGLVEPMVRKDYK